MFHRAICYTSIYRLCGDWRWWPMVAGDDRWWPYCPARHPIHSLILMDDIDNDNDVLITGSLITPTVNCSICCGNFKELVANGNILKLKLEEKLTRQIFRRRRSWNEISWGILESFNAHFYFFKSLISLKCKILKYYFRRKELNAKKLNAWNILFNNYWLIRIFERVCKVIAEN